MSNAARFALCPRGAGVGIRAQAYDAGGHAVSIPAFASTSDAAAVAQSFALSEQLARHVSSIRLYACTVGSNVAKYARIEGAAVQVLLADRVLFDFDLQGDFGEESIVDIGLFTLRPSGWEYESACTPVASDTVRGWTPTAPQLVASVSPPAVRPAAAPRPSQATKSVTPASSSGHISHPPPSKPAGSVVARPAAQHVPAPAAPQPSSPQRSARLRVMLIAVVVVGLFFALAKGKSGSTAPPAPAAAQSAETAAPSPTTGVLTQADAMKVVYGSYDPARNGSPWIVKDPPPKFSDLSGERLFVRAVAFASFIQGGAEKRLLLTSTSRYGQTGEPLKPSDDCHACGVLIGATVFQKVAYEWQVESSEKFLVRDGSWGAPPDMQPRIDASGALMIHFEGGDMAQGVVSRWQYDAHLQSGTWSVSAPIITEQGEPQGDSSASAEASPEQRSPAPPKNEATSFDCNKAKSAAEKLICSDSELAGLDRDLAALYARKLRESTDPGALHAWAVAEWKEREANCDSKECLLAWYVRRQRDLELNAGPPSSATR
jgi:hypothetical protein